MKILVIGFQRSGTTLLRRLIELHPDVKIMLHETRFLRSHKKQTDEQIKNYLLNYRVKKQVYTGTDPINETWGEKVPWVDREGNTIRRYANRWVKKFGKDARIIHIVRHPMDVALSNKRKINANMNAILKSYKISIPIVIKNIDSLILRYESLVSEPKYILSKVFEYCDLRYDDKIINKITSAGTNKLRYFDSIKKDRAYAYKKETLDIDFKIPDYEKILKKGGKEVL